MIDFAAITDKGKTRKDNEDYFAAQNNLFIVADGMGGHKAGDVASKLAVQTITKLNRASRGQADKEKLIEAFFSKANKAVNERAKRISHEQGMGTTMTLMLIDQEKAYIGHIGDSRAYLFRNGKLKQLTNDHSLVADMVQEGKITEEEAREHPYRNVITKALGSEEKIKPDIFSVNLKDGDRLLLCSDGLTSMVDDATLHEVLSSSETLKAAGNTLIKKANDNGGADNITAIVIDTSAKKSTQISLRAMTLLIAMIISAIFAYSAFNYVINNTFYIGFSGQKVAVFQGLPYRAGPLKLSKTAFVSKVSKEKLTPLWRERIDKTISVDSLNKGKLSVKEIEEEVKSGKGG